MITIGKMYNNNKTKRLFAKKDKEQPFANNDSERQIVKNDPK